MRPPLVMRRPQTLSTGLVVRQDFSDAVRAVFFQTEYDEFLYATHGGTLFVVSFQQRLYGITCKHVFGDFSAGRLFITQDKQGTKGSMPAPVKGLCYPSAPRDAAVGGDVVDICAIEFAADIAPDFFRDSPYIIDDQTVGTSAIGHELHVAGLHGRSVCQPSWRTWWRSGFVEYTTTPQNHFCLTPTLCDRCRSQMKPRRIFSNL